MVLSLRGISRLFHHHPRSIMPSSLEAEADKSSSSILSSVFTFVHREFESFVATAKGQEPPKVCTVVDWVSVDPDCNGRILHCIGSQSFFISREARYRYPRKER